LLGKSNHECGKNVVAEEEYLRVEKEINEKTEKFSIEQRLYFNITLIKFNYPRTPDCTHLTEMPGICSNPFSQCPEFDPIPTPV
jgi:hypothetical protein